MQSHSKIKAVGFDLDNTIYDQNHYDFGVFDSFIKTINPHELEESPKNLCTDKLSKMLNFHGIYSTKLHNELFEIYSTINLKLEPFKNIQFCLDYCQSEGLKTFIITNGLVTVQKNKIDCLKIASYFDLIIFAREYLQEKPAHYSFEAVKNYFDCDYENLVFFGNDLLNDFYSSHNLGLKAKLINPESDLIQFINEHRL